MTATPWTLARPSTPRRRRRALGRQPADDDQLLEQRDRVGAGEVDEHADRERDAGDDRRRRRDPPQEALRRARRALKRGGGGVGGGAAGVGGAGGGCWASQSAPAMIAVSVSATTAAGPPASRVCVSDAPARV